jgi:hypothetical protein
MQYNVVSCVLKRSIFMENRFTNFNKAKEEIMNLDRRSEVGIEEEKKKTYSFTLLPSERQMLKELSSHSSIRVSDSQFLGSIIREKYEEFKR